MHILNWNDDLILHELWVERNQNGTATLHLKVVKDLEPELLSINLPCSVETIVEAWQGSAKPISTAYEDSYVYSQVRCLFNIDEGCVVWAVNHVVLSDGKKMSMDRLALIPLMKETNNELTPKSQNNSFSVPSMK